MKAIVLAILFSVFLSGSLYAQSTGDFRTHQTGNWNEVNTWERFDGSVWVHPAPNTPTSADGVKSKLLYIDDFMCELELTQFREFRNLIILYTKTAG